MNKLKQLFKRKTEYLKFNEYKATIETKATLQWQNDTRKQSLKNSPLFISRW